MVLRVKSAIGDIISSCGVLCRVIAEPLTCGPAADKSGEPGLSMHVGGLSRLVRCGCRSRNIYISIVNHYFTTGHGPHGGEEGWVRSECRSQSRTCDCG